MKTLYQSLLLAIGALALAGTAFAQVPASNDTSDINSNTGMGTGALGGPAATSGGIENTAAGFDALKSNTSGNFNTALGDDALASNTTGSENTACGGSALAAGATGSDNTASGFQALSANTGNDNTATGANTLFSNRSGNNNTASGYEALFSNMTGNNNSASGLQALQNNTTGSQNTAFGYVSLQNNSTGSGNIAVGFQAGLDLTTGSHNIDIGNKGVAAESDTIRIGTGATQKATFIAGIKGVSVTGSAVMVSSTGQLGVTVSSERFKTAIAPMGANTAKLARLRPVTFHLKTDPKGALQYGLIAEEVANVYPELVIRDEKGRIDGVRYDELAPMLLNEAQEQRQKIATQADQIAAQAAQLRDVQQQLAAMQAVFAKLQAKDELVAQR
jgi:Chaperone of endosialidase